MPFLESPTVTPNEVRETFPRYEHLIKTILKAKTQLLLTVSAFEDVGDAFQALIAMRSIEVGAKLLDRDGKKKNGLSI